jgi:hypothetical protein
LWEESVRESLEIIAGSGVIVTADVDKDAFRRRTAAMYDDPDYATHEIRDLVRRIRATGLPAPDRKEGSGS